MYTRKRFRALDMLMWTRFETIQFIVIVMAWTSAYYFLDLAWLKIPWAPVAMIGTAVAFVIGFQNNSVYGRIWEARKIWGGIVNTSRTFGVFVQDMLSKEHTSGDISAEEIAKEVKTLTYRHIGWMTALRHAMRSPKPWETSMDEKTNKEWEVYPPERDITVEDDMKPYLLPGDMDYVLGKDNRPTAILYLQSHHLKDLKDKGIIWEFSFLELEGIIKDLFTLQGQSERMKNFPYPRQFATLNHYFMWILMLLLPVALVPQFADIGRSISPNYPIVGDLFIWLAVPIYVAVAWIFHTMERMGRTGENPFEGTANDVPISTIARGIEIDLRQNLGESKEDIPDQFPEQLNTQF